MALMGLHASAGDLRAETAWPQASGAIFVGFSGSSLGGSQGGCRFWVWGVNSRGSCALRAPQVHLWGVQGCGAGGLTGHYSSRV